MEERIKDIQRCLHYAFFPGTFTIQSPFPGSGGETNSIECYRHSTALAYDFFRESRDNSLLRLVRKEGFKILWFKLRQGDFIEGIKIYKVRRIISELEKMG